MDDLISRQDAIAALADYIHNVDNVIGTGRLSPHDCKDVATSVFGKLPSAKPDVIRCKDCKHYNAGFECLIEGYGIERDNDWYCADAERRTDEAD